MDTPLLSVVIASVNGPSILEECLRPLQQQEGVKALEVIVATRGETGVSLLLRKNYPQVKLIAAAPRTPIPLLRAMAIKESSSDLVAVLEDHCLVKADWARQMVEAHRLSYPVIGGSVENAACGTWIDWAAFFCEYSQAMRPLVQGEVEGVPGNNVSYKKWLLQRFQQQIEAGVWDFMLHKQMRREHIPLYSVPSITVYHKMSQTFKWFLAQKFHFARSFAGIRLEGSPWRRRFLYGAGAILLPAVLAQRIVTCTWKKGRYRRELLISLPLLLFLLVSWGLGEAVGYIFGPGSSTSRVC